MYSIAGIPAVFRRFISFPSACFWVWFRGNQFPVAPIRSARAVVLAYHARLAASRLQPLCRAPPLTPALAPSENHIEAERSITIVRKPFVRPTLFQLESQMFAPYNISLAG